MLFKEVGIVLKAVRSFPDGERREFICCWMLTSRGLHRVTSGTADLFSTSRSSQHVGDLTIGQNDIVAIFVFLLLSMQTDARKYTTATTTTEGVF